MKIIHIIPNNSDIAEMAIMLVLMEVLSDCCSAFFIVFQTFIGKHRRFPNVRTDGLKTIVLFYQCRHYCKCCTYIYKKPLSWYFWATVLWN